MKKSNEFMYGVVFKVEREQKMEDIQNSLKAMKEVGLHGCGVASRVLVGRKRAGLSLWHGKGFAGVCGENRNQCYHGVGRTDYGT